MRYSAFFFFTINFMLPQAVLANTRTSQWNLSPHDVRRVLPSSMKSNLERSSYGWWGVSAFCFHRQSCAGRLFRSWYCSLSLAGSRRTLRCGCSKSFVICRSYSVVKEPAQGRGLNCYRSRWRKIVLSLNAENSGFSQPIFTEITLLFTEISQSLLSHLRLILKLPVGIHIPVRQSEIHSDHQQHTSTTVCSVSV